MDKRTVRNYKTQDTQIRQDTYRIDKTQIYSDKSRIDTHIQTKQDKTLID